jgi:hypothetical protein
MIVEPFTPIKFYEAIVPNHDEVKVEYYKIVNQLETENVMSRELNGPAGSDDSLLTDYFTEDKDYTYSIWQPFCMKYLQEPIRDFMKQVELNDLAFAGIWSQISNGLQFHHPHTHGEVGWSFVWYIDVDPKVHKSTVWYAPPPADEIHQVKLEQNKIVIWPSWLLHYQPPSNSNVDRCIISGNIEPIKDNDDE